MLFSKICFCIITLLYVVPNGAPEVLPCKVPVFRYALEHWRPDPYEVAILHRGTLSEDAEALVASMEVRVLEPNGFVNLKVVRVDVETESGSGLLPQVLGPDFRNSIVSPEIVLLYPAESSSGPLAWRGPLTDENVNALFDSPARKQITQWILDGESVVWVLMPVGDAKKDVAAERLLRTEIARLEKVIKMRDIEVIESEKQFDANSKVELRLGIKLLVLDRDDPNEKIFAATLARSEDDLEELGEPFAIPVFGRGRAHLSLAGKGINPKMIETTCRFLIGDCSCEIKHLNPGVDLLFAVNWGEFFVGTEKDILRPDPTIAAEYIDVAPGHNAAQQNSDVETSRTANEEVAAKTTPFGQSRWVWIAGLIILGLSMVVVSARLRSQTRPG